MRTRALTSKVLALLAAVMLLLSSCALSTGSSNDDPVLRAERTEYAQQFMADLKDEILYERNNYNAMAGLGVVVTTKKGTKGIDYLDAFQMEYETGNPAQVTIAVDHSLLVVYRIVVTDSGNIFCYRYEFDEDKVIEVLPMTITEIRFQNNEQGQRSMVLYEDGRKRAEFAFPE